MTKAGILKNVRIWLRMLLKFQRKNVIIGFVPLISSLSTFIEEFSSHVSYSGISLSPDEIKR